MNSPLPGQQLGFTDLALNSSVQCADEPRLSRQAQAMLQLFLRARDCGEEVSNIQLREIGQQHNSRLFEVRRYLVRRGFCIRSRRQGARRG